MPFPLQLRLPFIALALTLPAFADTDKPSPEAAPSPAQAAWRDASLNLFQEANTGFKLIEGPEARLGEAVTLLLRQPKTDSNVSQATALLTTLVKDAPDSENGIAARYYLGRIAQIHRSPADPEAARVIYRELIKAHPGHPYAEQAIIKLAMIDLYERIPDEVRVVRFKEYSALAAGMRTPTARRDLNLFLADVVQRFRYDSVLALDFLIQADNAGIVRRIEQANNWVRIGELASAAGRPDVARTYYNKYLTTFIRDNRRLMIKERLAALPSSANTEVSK